MTESEIFILNFEMVSFPWQLFIAFFINNGFGNKGSKDVSSKEQWSYFNQGARLTTAIPSLATTSPLPVNLWQRPAQLGFLVTLNQILGGDS